MKDTSPRSPDLHSLGRSVKSRFHETKHLLSYDLFLDMVTEHPVRFARSAEQYIADMVEFYGPRPAGSEGEPGGWRVFDQPFRDGKGAVSGQAESENDVVRLLNSFLRAGRADRLILLHGPNGSSKSSLARCLIRGLEAYSHTPEGALYRFNWIFPDEKFTREGIGFGTQAEGGIDARLSYAELPEERVAARFNCPLRDNPLLLLPQPERTLFFDHLRGKSPAFARHELPESLLRGDLSPTNRQIFDALLSAYNGELERVLQHIQVERTYISERYGVGAVTIEPQMSVDAHLQQLTADRSLASLPPVLQNLSLFEPRGHLIQANHGLIEYSDLLKRPVETYKYLLGACEKGSVSLDASQIYLDLVMIGSANDKYLDAFKQLPDFTSFKGRMEFVRVPYLRRVEDEKRIYDEQLSLTGGNRPVTPHLTELTALWVVMTRLRRPDPAHYPEPVRPFVGRLNPLEKALFLWTGETPDWLPLSQVKDLLAARPLMRREFDADARYEGGFGASPREGKMILQSVLQTPGDACVAARHLFAQLRRTVADKSVYEWLSFEPDHGYHDPEFAISLTEQYYLRRADAELKSAMEMVEETQYAALVERYIAQVSAWLNHRKVIDPVSGQEKPVDLPFLEEIERILDLKESAADFRQNLVSRVAAWALENPNSKVPYDRLFLPQIRKIEAHYFSRRRDQVGRLHDLLLKRLSGHTQGLSPEQIAGVDRMLSRMENRFGYPSECTRELVGLLMQTLYAGAPAASETEGRSS